jgi:hypothetical protein
VHHMASRHRALFVFDRVLEKHPPMFPDLAEANLFVGEEVQVRWGADISRRSAAS